MSFSLTTEQVKNKTKTLTRRLGWRNLEIGELVQAVEKCQGLKKGEKVKRLCIIRIVNKNRERLSEIAECEVAMEGFPGLNRYQFIDLFCEANHCLPSQWITRIEFEYV